MTEDFIDLGSFMLEEVAKFEHLGSIVASDNSLDHEIAARISAASRCSWALNDLFRASSSPEQLRFTYTSHPSDPLPRTHVRRGLSHKTKMDAY